MTKRRLIQLAILHINNILEDLRKILDVDGIKSVYDSYLAELTTLIRLRDRLNYYKELDDDITFNY